MAESTTKRQVLKGAYVQAWLWVEARDPHDDPPVENPTDDQFRRWAKGQFESEGELEIDSNAVVSRSYDDADEDEAEAEEQGDMWDICQCEHAREEHDGNCNALTMERRARCSCPGFVLA